MIREYLTIVAFVIAVLAGTCVLLGIAVGATLLIHTQIHELSDNQAQAMILFVAIIIELPILFMILSHYGEK